jgi:hypothetical protein
MRRRHVVTLSALLITGSAVAAEAPAPPQEPSRMEEVGRKAGDIATQPVRDVGLSKIDIPPILVMARENPYSLKDTRTCAQLATQIKALSVELGDDFAVGNEKKENRVGRLAEAGGKTAVNSLLPFRGLVREISGAAPAQRRLNDAVDAGFARRGFLRGIHTARNCRTAL